MLGLKKILGQNNLMVQKKNLVKKKFWVRKKFWSKKNVGSKTILGPKVWSKRFGDQKNSGLKIFWVQKGGGVGLIRPKTFIFIILE